MPCMPRAPVATWLLPTSARLPVQQILRLWAHSAPATGVLSSGFLPVRAAQEIPG